MKFLFMLSFLCCSLSLMAAYQYETKGNQLWLTFDSPTNVSFGLERSGKKNDHENFIDRGQSFVDYGWYNLDTGEVGSFNNGVSIMFNENDRIGLYVKDNTGQIFTSTKYHNNSLGTQTIWGKSREIDGSFALYGGNIGSNGSHEYYVFKVNTINNTNGNTPSGQPLPGIIATLIIGGGSIWYIKKRKKLLNLE